MIFFLKFLKIKFKKLKFLHFFWNFFLKTRFLKFKLKLFVFFQNRFLSKSKFYRHRDPEVVGAGGCAVVLHRRRRACRAVRCRSELLPAPLGHRPSPLPSDSREAHRTEPVRLRLLLGSIGDCSRWRGPW